MKKIFVIFVLIFNFQSWSNAGDITDFELEGMSIGESALKYFSKNELKNFKFGFNSKEFAYVSIPLNKLNTYEDGLIIIKPTDELFKIHSISGRMFFNEDIDGCYREQETIADEFSNAFDQAKRSAKNKYEYVADKSGKSTVQTINFIFSNGSGAHVGCYNINIDYLNTNNMYPSTASLSVSLNSAQFMYFQKNR
jgi:hypothetical protein|tara:strand:- start:2648 stop:3232 length:585 start_codon:yes stop_codon:yes gene_type:complete